MCSHFPCFAPIQQYRFSITIKYTDFSLHQYILILPQRPQFYEDPICLLDPSLSWWSAPLSTVTTLHRYVNLSILSITTLFTSIFVVIFEFIRRSFVFLEFIFSPAVAASHCRLHIFSDMSLQTCERRHTTSAQSESCNLPCKPHLIPLLLF